MENVCLEIYTDLAVFVSVVGVLVALELFESVVKFDRGRQEVVLGLGEKIHPAKLGFELPDAVLEKVFGSKGFVVAALEIAKLIGGNRVIHFCLLLPKLRKLVG